MSFEASALAAVGPNVGSPPPRRTMFPAIVPVSSGSPSERTWVVSRASGPWRSSAAALV
jgi:hypothetical protein